MQQELCVTEFCISMVAGWILKDAESLLTEACPIQSSNLKTDVAVVKRPQILFQAGSLRAVVGPLCNRNLNTQEEGIILINLLLHPFSS